VTYRCLVVHGKGSHQGKRASLSQRAKAAQAWQPLPKSSRPPSMTSGVDHGPWRGPWRRLRHLGGQAKRPRHCHKFTRHFTSRLLDHGPSKCPWRCLSKLGWLRAKKGWRSYWSMDHGHHHGPWCPSRPVQVGVVPGGAAQARGV